MATTDDFGQGISIAALPDAPNANALIAGPVNALTQRSVMRFASASARNAALLAPVEGMVAWLQDANLLTVYDGAAWVAVSAGTQAWTTVGLVSGFAHNGNNNGQFQYRIVNLFGEQTIMFRGAVAVTYTGSTIPNGGVLNNAATPTSARPTSLRTIVVPCSDSSSARITLKMDIQTDGFFKIFGTGNQPEGVVTPPWIGFNGCFASL